MDFSSSSLADSPRIFDNDLLDRLSRIDHRVPLFGYGPIIAGLAIWSVAQVGVLDSVAGLAIGYFLWTLTEYFGHRFLFHWEMSSPLGARLHFLIHGVHHEYPSDPLRLVMPLLLSAPIMLIAAAILLPLGGMLGVALLAGFVAGYLLYDMVHFYVHHAQPGARLGRYLKRAHMLHHFRDHGAFFGVSAPWLDSLFGTARMG